MERNCSRRFVRQEDQSKVPFNICSRKSNITLAVYLLMVEEEENPSRQVEIGFVKLKTWRVWRLGQ